MTGIWPVPGPFFSGDEVSYFGIGQKHFYGVWLSSKGGTERQWVPSPRESAEHNFPRHPWDEVSRQHAKAPLAWQDWESPKPVSRRQTLETAVETHGIFLDPRNWAHWIANHWKRHRSVLSLMNASKYALTYIPGSSSDFSQVLEIPLDSEVRACRARPSVVLVWNGLRAALGQ